MDFYSTSSAFGYRRPEKRQGDPKIALLSCRRKISPLPAPGSRQSILNEAHGQIWTDDALGRPKGRCCCEDRFFLINELLDNELSMEQEGALRAHMEFCPSCAQEYRDLKATVSLLRHLALPEESEVKERIYASFCRAVPLQYGRKYRAFSFLRRLKRLLPRRLRKARG
jgi:hypothetical protein